MKPGKHKGLASLLDDDEEAPASEREPGAGADDEGEEGDEGEGRFEAAAAKLASVLGVTDDQKGAFEDALYEAMNACAEDLESMSQTVLRSELRARVRECANMENSTFVTDTQMNTRLDAAARRLYGKLVAARGQEYYRVTATLTYSAGESFKYFDRDFLQLLSVLVQDGGTWVRLKPFETAEIAALLNVGSPSASDYHYRLGGKQQDGATLEGDVLELCPVPAKTVVVRVDYVPTLACNGSGGSFPDVTYNAVSGFDDWIVFTVAAQCLAKQESDTSFLMTQLADIERDILTLAPSRDAGSPARVVDVRGGLPGDIGSDPLGLWRARP